MKWCRHCDAPLWRLRWSHEYRCGQWHAARARKRTSIAVTLVLLCLALLSLPARAQDAGADDVPRAAGIRRGLLELDDGTTLAVDGGVWLRTDVALLRAQDLKRLEAENKALRETPAATPTAVVVGVVVGLAVGLGAGAYVTVKACGATAWCH